MTNLSDKVAVVTGAASGLGRAIATELYRQGCHLALLDIDYRGLEKLRGEIRNENQELSIHKVDISQEHEIVSCSKAIFDEHGQIDILINNAGVIISQTFELVRIADYKRLFDINFWGAVYCTKHFLLSLKKQPKAHLIFIVSEFAVMGFPGKTTYGSSKGAVLAFANSLKTELDATSVVMSVVIPPPMNTNIVVNGLHIDEAKRLKEMEFMERNGMNPTKAARKIVHQLRRGKFRIVLGPMMFWADLASRLFPSITHYLISKNKKRIDFV